MQRNMIGLKQLMKPQISVEIRGYPGKQLLVKNGLPSVQDQLPVADSADMQAFINGELIIVQSSSSEETGLGE